MRQRYLGVMLPYTPLHILLLEAAGRPLVMTSGNLAEEPIVRDVSEIGRLAGIADYHLVHDREIAARYDDSVAIVRRERPRLVRRSRGYAPFPLALPRELPQVLACGAELKNTFCLTRDRNAFLSQHIGDLENLETLEHFEASVALYERLFRLTPEVVAYDLHPEYLATKYALARLDGRSTGPAPTVASIGVAGASPAPARPPKRRSRGSACSTTTRHLAACLAEHGRDGAGHRREHGRPRLRQRRRAVGRRGAALRPRALPALRPPRVPAAARRGARHQSAGAHRCRLAARPVRRRRASSAPLRVGFAADEAELAAVAAQVESGLNAPLTSSAGRLFDAVAALAGVREAVTYEGQAAIELEMVSAAGAAPYGFEIAEPAAGGEPHVVRLAALFDGVLADLEARAAPAVDRLAPARHGGGHHPRACRRARRETGLATVALSGGVFQNRLLCDLSEDALAADGFAVLSHERLPANDGGLSFGQAVVAGYTVLRRRGLLDVPPTPLER